MCVSFNINFIIHTEMGCLDKFNFKFSSRFWDNSTVFQGLVANNSEDYEGIFPGWLNMVPLVNKDVLATFALGKAACKLEAMTDQEVIDLGMCYISVHYHVNIYFFDNVTFITFTGMITICTTLFALSLYRFGET